ncbi:hypothetical protein AKJ52_01895 [candidate division MSBL1 archaeon SCGC-AAA382C18]|uniref:Uncharacterized protein n=1 Tax=candidate division MSBL1 archaeon SCGC-AAA382C18 TaxID=1698281 RepID=A0A133VJM8_9EURY|nr:hypothetical protein AKJ52_01895 [candidate division MSBL1 archaeon SCGC-AAA382C18]
MQENGQVFTFDMLLAVILGMLVVVSSGQALSIANQQATEYATRYSLERTALDVADVLVRDPGLPKKWHRSSEEIQTIGLADTTEGGEKIPNFLDISKISALTRLMKDSNWDPNNENTQAIMSLFGNRDKFQIKILDGDNCIWNLYPNWNVEPNSGASKSQEVVVSERTVCGRYGDLRVETGELPKEEPGIQKYPPENFWISSGDLAAYDWYIVINVHNPTGGQPMHISINPPPHNDYNPNPDSHWIEIDIDESLLNEGENNLIQIDASGLGITFEAWVVAIPEDTDMDKVRYALEKIPLTVRLKVWR